MHTPRAAERGFTLLEVLVAVAVFVIGFAGVIALQITAAKTSRNAKDISLAANLTAATLEELRIQPFDTVFNSTSYFDQFGGPVGAGDANLHFTVVVTISTDPGGTFKDADVETNWYYQNGYPHRITMATRLIPQVGP